MSSLFAARVPPPVDAGTFRALYTDPPWPEHGGGQIQRGADRHYPLMKVDEIAALPFGDWCAPDAHCYLWVTNNFLEDGFRVLRAWGFRYVTKVDWIKDKAGLGQYFRGMSEPCLFAVRGRLPYRTLDSGKRAQGRTVLYAPDGSDDLPDLPAAFEAPRQEHSKKPEEMRRIIERVSHGPYLETFARRPVENWTVWGNEITEVSCHE